jgi:hypothetical protein
VTSAANDETWLGLYTLEQNPRLQPLSRPIRNLVNFESTRFGARVEKSNRVPGNRFVQRGVA